MNKIKILFFVTVAFFATIYTNAQSQAAYIDFAKLVSSMPEKSSIDTELQNLADKKRTEIKNQEEALTQKYKKVSEKYANKTPEELSKIQPELEKIQKEFQEDQQKLDEFKNEAARSLDAKQQEMYAPLFKKVKEAIEKVARAKNLNFVLDSSQPSVLYAGGMDISDLVKKSLETNN